MSAQATHPEHTQTIDTQHHLSFLEQYVLRRSHPRGIFIDTVGLIWFVYYFWNHDWIAAIGALLVFRIFALLGSWKANPASMAQTTLGKIALLHLHPTNIMTQTLGVIVTLYGLWQHSTEFILVGLSVVLLGHLFGWSRVDTRLAVED